MPENNNTAVRVPMAENNITAWVPMMPENKYDSPRLSPASIEI
jgi:hypothetical protein